MHVTPTVVDPAGRRFVEESSLLSLRAWRHERIVEALPGGCRVTDRLTPVPRAPGTGPIVRAVVGWLFAHPHRRLRARFGPGPTPRSGR